jgi:hypothetical protein
MKVVGSWVAEDTRQVGDEASIRHWWENELLPQLEGRELGSSARAQWVMGVLRTSYDALKEPALRDAFVLLAGMWPDDKDFRDDAMVVRNLAATVHRDARNPTMQAKQTLAELTCRSMVKQTRIQLDGSAIDPLARGTFRVVVHDLLSDLGVELADGDRAGMDLQDRRFCRWVGRDQLPPTPTGATRWEHLVVGPSNMPDLPSSFFGTQLKLRSLVVYSRSGVNMPPLYPGLAGCGLLMVHECTDVVWPLNAFAGLVNLRVLDVWRSGTFEELLNNHLEVLKKRRNNLRDAVVWSTRGEVDNLNSSKAFKDRGTQGTAEKGSECRDFAFPGSLPSEVGRLTHLRMSGSGLRRVWDTLPTPMAPLVDLDMDNCKDLVSLPEAPLSMLQRLSIYGCPLLYSLPEDLCSKPGQLQLLKHPKLWAEEPPKESRLSCQSPHAPGLRL